MLLAVPVALVLGLAACGGNDSSSERASSIDAGTTSASGPTGSTGTSGRSGKTGSTRTGGSKTPSAPSAQAPATNSSPSGSSRSDSSKRSDNRAPKDQAGAPYSLDNPTEEILANLYTEARTACKVLTLQGLATEYEVPATVDAVAKAYAKAYAKFYKNKKVRDAVYRGCKDGVS